jgi:cytochrome P450
MSTVEPAVSVPEPDERSAPGRCPVRKLAPVGEPGGADLPRVAEDGGRWVIRSFGSARQVLRDSERVRQAGFGADRIARAGGRIRPPVLYLEGPQHRAQRKAAARLFAPKVIEDYRDMMEELSASLLRGLRTDRPVDLSRLSLAMAVQVAARVVGLTSSSVAGMTRRLDSFFRGDTSGSRLDPRLAVQQLGHRTAMLRFFYLDVKPAIRARRRRPQDDVISQLLEQGFSDLDILTECVTYGAAGMATTREFITVAAWHLLDDAELLSRYRAASREERLHLLEETLRLEPVVGHLFRRTTAPLTLSTPDGERELPVDTLVDLDLRAINADPPTVGSDPLGLCPGRPLPGSVPPSVMSFGDGNHRCPGGPLALMESEVFLSALLDHDVEADGPPTVRWNATTQGYELNDFRIRLRR